MTERIHANLWCFPKWSPTFLSQGGSIKQMSAVSSVLAKKHLCIIFCWFLFACFILSLSFLNCQWDYLFRTKRLVTEGTATSGFHLFLSFVLVYFLKGGPSIIYLLFFSSKQIKIWWISAQRDIQHENKDLRTDKMHQCSCTLIHKSILVDWQHVAAWCNSINQTSL